MKRCQLIEQNGQRCFFLLRVLCVCVCVLSKCEISVTAPSIVMYGRGILA